MIERNALQDLKDWKSRPSRKPLILRGARQVGKSYLVRQFAKQEFVNLIEINLEYQKELLPYLHKQDPHEIVRLLSLHFNREIIEGATLLFLDEIQAASEVIAKLRYFYEMIPNLHIIAAGSLLDFVLEEHTFSMPVGRIEYYYLGPVTFLEFLRACGSGMSVDFLENYQLGQEFPIPLHQKLIECFKQYLIVGGMPESVATFMQSSSYLAVDRVKQALLGTYLDDFAKYGTRVKHSVLETVFKALPHLPGSIVKYSTISRDFRPEVLARALHLLSLARVCTPIFHTVADGVPLSATENRKKMKVLYLDTGLLTAACGLSMLAIEKAADVLMVNSGCIAEQFVGQHLLYRRPLYREPQLHFWTRNKASSNAEIDYVISCGTRIIGIEVKAGTTGSLKSLNQFIVEKNYPTAVRFNLDTPSRCQSTGRMPAGDAYDFTLLSLPCYMVEQVDRLLGTV